MFLNICLLLSFFFISYNPLLLCFFEYLKIFLFYFFFLCIFLPSILLIATRTHIFSFFFLRFIFIPFNPYKLWILIHFFIILFLFVFRCYFIFLLFFFLSLSIYYRKPLFYGVYCYFFLLFPLFDIFLHGF